MAPSATPVPFDSAHPDALAVYCSDGRFTNAVEALLAQRGVPRLDTLTIPGGPALLDLTSANLGAVDAVRTAVSFLITGHRIARTMLIAHEGCGYYKQRLPYESPDAMMRRQTADLRAAERWVRANHPRVEVTLFFARVIEGRVAFDVVT